MQSDTGTITLFAVIIFLSSALVLVLEMVAARLIAPFVGVSLYSWTAIIGTVLAGLSIGNWIGGVMADRSATQRSAGFVLLAASASAFLILLILPRIAGPIQTSELSLAGSSLALTMALFFLPALLLGIVTPLLTTLALQHSQRTGHIIGMMHALAALGSILGTFATGFWLVQWFGSRNLVLTTAIALAVLAVPLLKRVHLAGAATGLVLLLILVQSPFGYANPCDAESRYFCMRVVDASDEVPFGEARALILDHLQHSTNHREDPELIAAPYLHLIDRLGRRHTQDNDTPAWFFAGGGAYTLPRTVNAYKPAARVVVAEIDPAVTEIAREQLYIDTANMEVIHEDARVALAKQPQGAFDVVVGDVFHDIAVPYHLLTREFAALVKSRLKPDGLYLMNLVDGFPDAKLLKSLYKTLQQEFAHVDIWLDHVSDEPTRMTYIVSAHNNNAPMPERIVDQRFGRQWINITEPALAAGTGLDELPLLTDDFVPVERLLAELLAGELGR
ncbi:MAG: fused MFS/spermidine synthase [Gammaproteobacteria bacterium]